MTFLKGLVRRADAGLHGLQRLFRAATVIILAVMLAINAVNIFWRGAFDKSLNVVWPLTLFLFVWMSFLGFYLVYRESRDIRMDFIINMFGRPGRIAGRVLVDVLAIGLSVLIVLQVQVVLESQIGEIQMLPIQRYWLSVPLFVSFFLILLHFIVDLAGLVLGMELSRRDPADVTYLAEE